MLNKLYRKVEMELSIMYRAYFMTSRCHSLIIVYGPVRIIVLGPP